MRKIFATFFIGMIFVGAIAFGAENIAVGSKNFTEQYIVGNMISLLLKANGFNVSNNFGLSSIAVRSALTTGQIDLYADYTGTAWVVYFKHKELIQDPVRLYDAVKEEDLRDNNVVWFDRIDVNDTYALAVTREFATEHNLKSISDLASLVNKDPGKYRFGVDFEFYQRPDGFFAMAKEYGFDVPRSNVKAMEIGLTYDAIKKGEINVAMVFSTDGKLQKYDLVVLRDNKNFFPVYNLAITARKGIVDKYPQIKEILRPLSLYLNNEVMTRLNYLVDSSNESPEEIARAYLNGLGLLQ